MMRLFLDTEFNGYDGEMISMALVTEEGDEWYQCVTGIEKLDPWVVENVMPKLGRTPIAPNAFAFSLQEWISKYDGCEIIADWPADFEHLCARMSGMGMSGGWRIPIECTMRLIRGDDTIAPENPHNALSDARALRDWWLRQAGTVR